MHDFDSNFRRESARLTAVLVSAFSPENLTVIEDAVQETFIRALKLWSMHGVPANTAAWLNAVARNLTIDALRHEQRFVPLQEIEAPELPESADEELRMLFLCSHPALRPEAQIALTLKLACGFSVQEIARALLSSEEAIAQRLVRAKAHLREVNATFDMPMDEELDRRMSTVLQVIYLLFNEGYLAASGPLSRHELCEEAIGLAKRLAGQTQTRHPELHALLALMLFNTSRLAARQTPEGNMILLEHQDRTCWDQNLIAQGLAHLAKASQGDLITPYHCQAAIASAHATAATFQETDWAFILQQYDLLLTLAPSPIVRLNRTVALLHLLGPDQALQEVRDLESDKGLKSYHLLPALKARLLEAAGHPREAKAHYARALELAVNDAERAFLLGRIQ